MHPIYVGKKAGRLAVQVPKHCGKQYVGSVVGMES